MIRRLLALALLVPSLAWAANAYKTYMQTFVCGVSCTAYWPMDETSGTTLANACAGVGCTGLPSTQNLTTSGTPTLNQAGANAQRGPSIAFASASSQYGEVNASGGTQPGALDASTTNTAGCWVKIATNTLEPFVSVNSAGGTAANRVNWEVGENVSNNPRIIVWQSTTLNVFYFANGTTTMDTSSWYFIVGTWTGSTHTVQVFAQGVLDASSNVDQSGGGGTFGTQNYLDVGRRNATLPSYLNANAQDCFVMNSKLNDASILALYNQGVAVPASRQGWPFSAKRSELPRFRNDDYLTQMVSRGYNTGHFTAREIVPQYLLAAYIPFSKVPWGNVGH